MKNYLIWSFLLVFYQSDFKAQNLIMKGRIKCLNQSPNSSKGAENVVVVPTFVPSKACITASQPAGYFEFNTGIPFQNLQDKQVSIYVVSRCKDCEDIEKRIFISEDQDRLNRDDTKRYVTIKDWMLNANCKQAEFKALKADSVLQVVVKQAKEDLEKVSSATALVGAPTFLNFLTSLTSFVGTNLGVGTFSLKTLQPAKISYGQFLFASPLLLSANTGFNFSPARDLSEAVFWNPSAIGYARKPTNISLLTNLKNNTKLTGYFQIANKFSISAGLIYNKQDEFRSSVFNDFGGNPILVDSAVMNLKEFAIFIAPVFKFRQNFSMGLTIKSVWQNFNIPNELFVQFKDQIKEVLFTDTLINKHHLDMDISFTYKLNTSFQVGMNLMNLVGSEFYSDAFVRSQSNTPVQNQRSLGLGLLYKWQRIHIGSDFLVTNNGLYDAALGLNYVPFNNALISAGIAVKQLSYSFAFRMKYFRIAYINDNDFLINEKRKGKSSFFNGKIHGGFVYDF